MTIKVKLYIIGAISIGLVLSIGLFVFFISQNIKQEMEECEITEEISRGMFDLNVLTNDYLLHQEERARIQWQSRYDSLAIIFTPDMVAVFDEDERDLLRDLRDDYENIEMVFAKLIAGYEQQSPNSEESAALEELEERLIGQLLIHSQTIVSKAIKLDEDTHNELGKSQHQSRIFIFSFLAILVLLIIAVVFWVIYNVVRPIGVFKKGAEVIGKGNLDYRLNIKTGDEFEYLASEFNRMADKLKKSYGDLEQKVKERTAELEEAKNRSEVLLASIGDGVFAIDKERNIIHFNKQAEELSGYKSSEVLGKPYYDVLKFVKEKDRSENIAFIRKALNGETSEMADETVLIRKDQIELAVEDSAAPLKDEKGEVFGVIVVFRDATKEREIQQMRSEFNSLVSHELRSPLGVIGGYLEMLRDERTGKLTKEQRKLIDQTTNASGRLLKLVDELLDVARFEEGRIETEPVMVDPADLAEKAVTKDIQQLFKEKKQKFIFKKPASLSKIRVDPRFIITPIQNLLSNASKYTPAEGKIEFEVSQKDNRVIFKVTDSGIGIPRDEQFNVFQRFFRASNTTHLEKGTGLGLYMTKLMIEASRGRIRFESEKNKGTTFYFTLPVV